MGSCKINTIKPQSAISLIGNYMSTGIHPVYESKHRRIIGGIDPINENSRPDVFIVDHLSILSTVDTSRVPNYDFASLYGEVNKTLNISPEDKPAKLLKRKR